MLETLLQKQIENGQIAMLHIGTFPGLVFPYKSRLRGCSLCPEKMTQSLILLLIHAAMILRNALDF